MTLPSSYLYVQLFRHLAEPAFRALALAALAGLALTLGRAKDVAVRLAVWTTVLYAALAMPFLARLAPAVRLPMPAFLASQSFPLPSPAEVRRVAVPQVRAALVAAQGRPPGQPQGLPRHGGFSWPLVAVALYLLIAGVSLGQLAVGFYFSRRLKLFSNPVGDRRVLSIMLEQSTRWGLRTAPGLAESRSVTVPVTLGAWHPFVLLPTAWRTWSDEKIQAVLAHELSHVVRRDALTRAVAAIHRSFFWFSPLAWWLERHLAALAEQASDDAALRTGADRIFYADVLLGFYQDLQSSAGRVRWEGLAMARGKQARERMDRILDSSRRLSAGLKKPAWAALVLLAVPLIYLPAGAQPIVARKPHADERRALEAPVIRPAVESRYAELQAPPAGPPAPESPAPPAAPKPAPGPAPAPKPPTPPSDMLNAWTYGVLGEEAVISYGDSFHGYGTFNSSDFDHFKALRRASNSDFIWFRRDGKAYIIRDPAIVERAKDIYARLRLLEQTQENLQFQQDLLSAQQEELSRQMGRARVEVPDLTAELQNLRAQLDQVHKQGATQDQLSELQNGLGDLQKKLSELQGEAGGIQGAIGGEKGDLGGRQAELGDQMRQLAERQARLAKETSQKIKALLDDALAKGVAKPE